MGLFRGIVAGSAIEWQAANPILGHVNHTHRNWRLVYAYRPIWPHGQRHAGLSVDVGTIIESLMQQFESEGWRTDVANIPQADLTARSAAEQVMTPLQTAAQAALIAQVAAARPSAGGSLGELLSSN